jgi:hypothetical protein
MMTTKEKNKLQPKTKSKILVLGFLFLMVLVGLFVSAGKAWAAPACYNSNGDIVPITNNTKPGCDNVAGRWLDTPPATGAASTGNAPGTCQYSGGTVANVTQTACAAAPYNSQAWVANTNQTVQNPQSQFATEIGNLTCFGIAPPVLNVAQCGVQFAYYILYIPTAFLLAKTAYFFNVLISVTLNGAIFKQAFVPQAWGIVRDLSNIFFILILLYVAIELILGLSGDAKKIITRVIIMALLINFSLFFTQIVIDTSNVIALVFYNKISVNTTNQNGSIRPYDTIGGEKDVAGGLVSAFDPTKPMTKEFFDATKRNYIDGQYTGQANDSPTVPAGTLIAITLIAVAIMGLAIYALLVSGLSFLGRLIELWVLSIFSPFAFMSWTLPKFSGIEDIGWEGWSKRLVSIAFMAPIFMFELYFIFLLISSGIFNMLITPGTSVTSTNVIGGAWQTYKIATADPVGATKMLLGVVLPAIFICILLLQAAKSAKKGAGKFGDIVMTGAKMVGGLALGGAVGGAAVLGRATVGRAGAAMANSDLAKRWEARGWGGEYARRRLSAVGSGSFDARGVKIGGKTLASATGMSVGEAGKGGFTERRKADVENRMKRAKELGVGEDEELTQILHAHENALQDLRAEGSHEIGEIDKRIEGAIKADKAAQSALNAARGTDNEADARAVALATSNRVNDLRGQRGTIKNATGDQANMVALNNNLAARQAHLQLVQQAGNANDIAQAEADLHATQVAVHVAAVAAQHGNRSMNNYEDTIIPGAHHAIENESRRRKRIFADTTEGRLGRAKNFVFSGGQSSHKGSVEAAHKIRMEAKIEEKGNGGGH